MPIGTPPLIADGFNAYRCTPLPSGIQPLVLLGWRSYVFSGDDTFEVQYLVLTEAAMLEAKEARFMMRHLLHHRTGQATTREEILAFMLDKAKVSLEAQALNEFSAGQSSNGTFQPVELRELDKAAFQLLALRTTWKSRWDAVRAKTKYTPLGEFLEALRFSPLSDYNLIDL